MTLKLEDLSACQMTYPTQISGFGFGSSSRHLIFFIQLRLQHLELFASGSRTIWPKKTEKTWYYLYNSVEPAPKFRAPAPAIQNYLGSGPGIGRHRPGCE